MMLPFQILLALTALFIGTVLAVPEPLLHATRGRKTFTLYQTPVRRTQPWRGPMSMRRAYLKHGLTVPAAIEKAAKQAEESALLEWNAQQKVDEPSPSVGGKTSTPVIPVSGDVEFLITAQVGNHNLSLDLDTGSSDLWVFSTLQPVEQRNTRPVNRVYDPNGSNARPLSGHVWQIRYGDMSGAQGQVYLDNVTIGDLTVESQAVEAAASVSRTFTRDNKNDGLLGLAFSKLNTVKPKAQKTWFDNVRPQLAQPVFTAALKRRAVGTYDFGYIDKGKYKGDIVWTPITGTKGFWDFTPTGYSIGNGPVVDYNITAIADTGTSLWYLPKPAADAYWEQVPGASFSQGQQGYIFPCHAKLPDISLVIAGKKITVPGSNMNYQGISVTTCFGGLQRNDRMPFSIFGDTFLKGLFVAFEAPLNGQARIGFAQQPLS